MTSVLPQPLILGVLKANLQFHDESPFLLHPSTNELSVGKEEVEGGCQDNIH